MTIENSPYALLIETGRLSAEQLAAAEASAQARGVEVERILLRELGIDRCALLNVLAKHYDCRFIQYDERIPVPPHLFAGLDAKAIRQSLWFPVMQQGHTVIIAAADPGNEAMREQVRRHLPNAAIEYRVALREDVRWFILDYLHDIPEKLIGIERTELAYWRNIMALWRTKLACHRTGHARARTSLKLLRWGLAMVAFSNALTRLNDNILAPHHAAILVAGLALAGIGLIDYLKVRRSRMDLSCAGGLEDITERTTRFTAHYQLPERPMEHAAADTPHARLAAAIPPFCSYVPPVPASKERTYLARERNMMAAQRTLGAIQRTIYARARTGLSWIRTGVSFIGLGLAMHKTLGGGPYAWSDWLMIGAGAAMLIDGLSWYLPARKMKSGMGRDLPNT